MEKDIETQEVENPIEHITTKDLQDIDEARDERLAKQ